MILIMMDSFHNNLSHIMRKNHLSAAVYELLSLQRSELHNSLSANGKIQYASSEYSIESSEFGGLSLSG